MTRKICIVTGTRAEYGLLRWVMQSVSEAPELTLQIIATGMHLSPEFGLTYREIEQDGFRVDRKVEMLMSSDTPVGISKSMGLGMIGFADALHELKPDLLVVLGDRFEIFSAVSAALVARIPVAHLHGGERSEGAFDESIRHCITKMSHLHFVAAEEYRKRVIQLGEDPKRVFCVGGLGVDAIKRVKFLGRKDLEDELGFKLGSKNLLITFHPETLGANPQEQMAELLAVLQELPDTHLIFTMPNADTGGRAIIRMIEEFVGCHPNARSYVSLGQQRYLSCLQFVDAVIGNSSSGLTEVPSFKIGTINIGNRQQGRMKALNVIDCSHDRQSVLQAIERLYSSEFQASLSHTQNPYGEGGSCEKIVEIIRDFPLENIQKKIFCDS